MSVLDRLPMRVWKKTPTGGKLAARSIQGAISSAYPDLLRRLSHAKNVTTNLRHRMAIEDALSKLLEMRRALEPVFNEITEVVPAGRAPTGDAAQDILEDPCGAAEREEAGFRRVHVSAMRHLNESLRTSGGSPDADRVAKLEAAIREISMCWARYETTGIEPVRLGGAIFRARKLLPDTAAPRPTETP